MRNQVRTLLTVTKKSMRIYRLITLFKKKPKTFKTQKTKIDSLVEEIEGFSGTIQVYYSNISHRNLCDIFMTWIRLIASELNLSTPDGYQDWVNQINKRLINVYNTFIGPRRYK